MKIKVNADDFGASLAVNRNIMKAVKTGALNKVSIMVNGNAFEEACVILRETELEHTLHLNLCEGKPVSPASEVPHLVDSTGYFETSYIKAWLYSQFSSSFRGEIKREVEAQIRSYREAFPELNKISLDSHQYYHLIPPVLNQILKIHKNDNSISILRMVDEPFIPLKGKMRLTIKNLFSANIIKWLLLKVLTRMQKKKISKAGIRGNCSFCGVFYSGSMTGQLLDQFKKYDCRGEKGDSFKEILFHPGGADPSEAEIWKTQPDLAAFYLSPARAMELKELLP